MRRLFLPLLTIFLLSILMPEVSFAAGENKDSLSAVAKKRANRVALMSAIIPGAGQFANKKYWKVPVIYGGAAVIAYFVKINNDEYKKYKEARLYKSDNDSTTLDPYPQFTDQDVKNREDYYRRNRDLSYIFAGVLYVLNIVDAYVDSQLMDFDVSDNLSLRINPAINSTRYNKPVPSLNLVFSFK
jgi:hypothetical protein